ncbi:hypothetical protein ACS0TY_005376 [Phlomoides rotata]
MSNPSRRIKWHPTPPPPPSPKIIHFPRRRRTRRKHHHQNNSLLLMHQRYASSRGNLETLFDQENTGASRRERVEEEEEKWRVQAEMLRAECNSLRMERELALRKLEKNRVKMETTLRSAVNTLVSGREKIFEGKNANAVLEEEIEDLEDKLEELHKSSRIKAVKCSNFDKKAWILQRRLEKLADETTISNSKSNIHNEEKKKMEEREEDHKSTISVASSASTSKRIEFHLYQEEAGDENKCSGRCKAIVRKIVEQVRAETEQWSQMQQMLVMVRGEMEELQTSRDYWQNRAHHSDYEIQSLSHTVEEWKEKALEHENKANRLEVEVSQLKEEMQKCKVDVAAAAQLVKKDRDLGAPLSLGKQLANEKRMLRRRLKENVSEEVGRRIPFKDIGNSSALPTPNPIHTPAATHSFRK